MMQDVVSPVYAGKACCCRGCPWWFSDNWVHHGAATAVTETVQHGLSGITEPGPGTGITELGPGTGQ